MDSREWVGGIYPFFSNRGEIRFLVIDAPQGQDPRRHDPQDGGRGGREHGGVWVVEEFPLEIRQKKAIYPRPIARYHSLQDADAATFQGLHHLDLPGVLTSRGGLSEGVVAAIESGNLARQWRGRETLLELYFTLDLRRVTGGVSRSGFFKKRRLEPAGVLQFAHGGWAPQR